MVPPHPAPIRPAGDSADELRALLAAMTDVVLVLDADGRYVRIAPTNPALLYRPAPELLGKTLDEVFPPERAREFLSAVRQALATRASVALDYSLPIGGAEVWFSATFSPMAEQNAVAVVARDVTPLKHAEEALRADILGRELAERKLRASEERFRALVEHSLDIVVLLDAAGTVLYASESTNRVLGYDAVENVGQSAFAFVDPNDRPELERLFLELVAIPGHVMQTQFRARHKDGSWRYVEGTAINRLADPAVGAVVFNYRDITERKRSEQVLNATLSLLAATLESTADGILVIDGEGRIASYNDKYARIWRVPDEVLASRDAGRLERFLEEQLVDPEGFRAKLDQLARRPDAESFDLLLFRDGRAFERYSQPQRIAGTVVGRVFSFRDVTNQTRAERVQTAVYRIADAANTAPDLPALLRTIHDIISGLMAASNFYIAIYDPGSATLSFPYFVDEYDIVDAPRPLGRGLTEYVLRTGQPLLATPDVHAALEGRGEVELIGTPSLDWLGVPLKTHDRTIGVLVAQSYAEGLRFGEAEKHILQFVSTQVALAIDRKRAEEGLQASEHKYRLLFDSNPEPMWVHDRDTLRFLAVNHAALTRYGYTRDQFLSMTVRDVYREADPATLDQALRPAAGGGPATDVTQVHHRRDGTAFEVEVSGGEIAFESRPARLVLARDVTERRHLEEQLRQSQKMEAVGRLAGGIAHDFNNLLTAILGYCQLLERQLEHDEVSRKDVEEVRRAAERAASLTQQLLAFSRKQVLRVQSVNLNAVVADVEKLLRRMIGEDIELVTVLRGHVAPVRADPNQLQQVLVNLAINARDAMPKGGRLTIATAQVEPDDPDTREHPPTDGGRYVALEVSDTGLGMDAHTRAHLFEPFFTTKDVGKGTGLGLATVYGIIKQFGGYIWVHSEPGQGATFKIHLPCGEEVADELPAPAVRPPRGSETVLIVEDEESVRSLAQKVLRSEGYTVLDACAGPEALGVRASYTGRIHLLLTDVIMPGMSGRELAEQLIPLDYSMRVLYMSGYTDDAMLRRGVLEKGTAYIQKPFTPDALARRVREVLDGT